LGIIPSSFSANLTSRSISPIGIAATVAEAAAAVCPIGQGTGVAKGVKELTPAQLINVERFIKKLPANAKDNVSLQSLPNSSVAAQAVSPGRVPGSSAVYEKQIDATGTTIQYTKTTYDPAGNIVHVKDKITGDVLP